MKIGFRLLLMTGQMTNLPLKSWHFWKKYNAKATFFCIGQQVEKHPKDFKANYRRGAYHRKPYLLPFKVILDFLVWKK